ncbi:MAG TPA: alpha/beta hydrolase [Steroidobacteraceae bacterium]|nr:alpha/beta hydrolase [Steroidobacteraceae bacterium]
MSQEQLAGIIEMLRGGAGPDLTQPAAIARRQFSDMLANIPPPQGIDFAPIAARGVRGFWSRTPEAAEHRVLLYLHGGGYVIGDAWSYRPLWSGLAQASRARGLGIDYRLAPEHPFPAAVEDAVAAYRWLIDEGYSPASIAVAGDSAGGGLAIAALAEARRLGLPPPAAALALSPWADLACTADSIYSNAAADPSLTRPGLLNCAAQYLGAASSDAPLASPVGAELAGLPPLLIQVGSIEILLDDAVRLARRAGAAGVHAQLEIWPGMPHVWHAFSFALDEGRSALAQAGAFLAARLR